MLQEMAILTNRVIGYNIGLRLLLDFYSFICSFRDTPRFRVLAVKVAQQRGKRCIDLASLMFRLRRYSIPRQFVDYSHWLRQHALCDQLLPL